MATTADRAAAQSPPPPHKPAAPLDVVAAGAQADLFLDKAAWARWDALPLAVKTKIDPRILAELSGAVMPAHELRGALDAPGDAARQHAAFQPPAAREPLAATRFIVYLVQQPNLEPFSRRDGEVTSAGLNGVDAAARRTRVLAELAQTAQTAQAGVRAALVDARSEGDVEGFHSFYIVNALAVEGGLATLAALAQRPDVARIAANYPLVPLWDEQMGKPSVAGEQQQIGDAWHIDFVGAPAVWELGVRGEGVTVAGFDTGVDATHPGLAERYRGYRGTGNADHDYNWFEPDGTLDPDGNLGESVSSAPRDCDFLSHGTHTMGTMVGEPIRGAGGVDNPATAVGMAPGAQWIAVPGICGTTMPGTGLVDDIGGLKAFQWLLCPTDLSGDLSTADCSRAPAVVNNSWGSANPVSDVFRPAIQALRAAGIATVFAAGNPYADEGSIGSPGSAPEAITVSATDRNDRLTDFSARGPSFYPGEQKPELSAPGAEVVSTVGAGGYGSYSGTSMAAPHVAGLIALLVAVDLRDGVRDFDVDDLERAMTRTAVDLGPPGPDERFGWGRIDALAAVNWTLSAGDLRGTVRDAETGEPLPNVSVTGISGAQRFAARTDADGRYAITVPAGRYTVRIDAWGYEPANFAGQTVFADSLSTADFALVPQPRFAVEGTVRVGDVPPALANRSAATGDAIAGARIYVRTSTENGQLQNAVEAITGPDGGYTLTLPLGRHEVVYEASGYRPATRVLAFDEAPSPPAAIEAVALDAAPAVLLVDADAHGGWFGGWSVQPIFERALGEQNYAVDTWRIEHLDFEDTRELVDGSTGHGIPSTATLATYDVVVWAHSGCGGIYCFRGGSPASIGAEAALVGYLDGGGRLLLSGQNIAGWDDEASVLFDRYLRLDGVREAAANEGDTLLGQGFLDELELPLTNAALFGYSNGTLYFTPDAVAVDADPDNLADEENAGDDGDSLTNDNAFADDAGNDNGVAFPILSYANGAGAAALAIQPCDAPHRAVYLGMGFEAVGPRAERENPQYSAVLGRSIEWMLEGKPEVAISLSSPEREQVAAPGERARYTLRLTNRGSQPTTVDLALSSEWTAQLFVDETDTGDRTGDPLPLTGSVALAPCEAQVLTAVVDVPLPLANNAEDALAVTAAPVGGEADRLTLRTRAFARWMAQPAMPSAVSRHATAALPGAASLYTFGGFSASFYGDSATDTVQRFDACARSWSPVAPLPQPRAYGAAAALGGKFYVAGGLAGLGFVDEGLPAQNTLFVYDPAANPDSAWREASPLPQPLVSPTLTALGDKLYLAGGTDGAAREVATLYEYDPAADAWRELPDLPGGPRTLAAAAALDGELYVVGGWPALRTVEIYDPASNSWRTGPDVKEGRHSAGLVAGPDNALYLVGGGASWYGTDVVERYAAGAKAGAGAWVEISSPLQDDYFGGAAFVAGQLTVAGGELPSAAEALRLGTSFCHSDVTLNVPGLQPGATFSYTVSLAPDRQPLEAVRVSALLPEAVDFVGFGENNIGAVYDAETRTVAWSGALPAAGDASESGNARQFSYAVALTDDAAVDGQRVEAPVRFEATRPGGGTLAFERTARARVFLPDFRNSALDASIGGNRVGAAISGDVLRYDVQVRSATIAGGRASLRSQLPPQLDFVPGSLALPPGTQSSDFDADTRTLSWTGDTRLDPDLDFNEALRYSWRDSSGDSSPIAVAGERVLSETPGEEALVEAANVDAAYEWIDIRETGTLAVAGDDVSRCGLPLGFPFEFYGELYEAFCVSTNGTLDFAAGDVGYTPACPLATASASRLIAPLWSDLVVSDGVYFQTLDDAGGRRLVVQWAGVRFYGGFGTGQPMHFELILYESGIIKMQYQALDATASEMATVGLLGPTAEQSLTYTCREPDALAGERAVLFLPPGRGTDTAEAVVAFEAQVAADVPPNTPVTSTVTVQGAGQTFTRTTEVLLNPLDLSESTASVARAQVNIGEAQGYRFVLQNTGLYTATAATLTASLGNALSGAADSVACSRGTCALDGDTLTWAGPIAAGEPVTLSFSADLTAMLPDRTPVTGTATLGDGYGNAVTMTTSFVARSSDLTQSSAVMQPRFVEPGMEATVEITVRNTGAVASETSVRAALPDGLLFVDGSLVCGTGACALAGNEITWAGLVMARETVPVRFRVRVPDDAPLGQSFDGLVVMTDGNRGETIEMALRLAIADLTWMSTVHAPPAPVEIYLPVVGR